MNSPKLKEVLKRKDDARAVREHWQSCFSGYTPSERTFYQWVYLFGAAIAKEGITAATHFVQKRHSESKPVQPDVVIRYASGCMWNMKRANEGQS